MILFPPLGFGPTAEPQVTTGEGFTLYRAPDGDSWIMLEGWTAAVERVIREGQVSRVILTQQWSTTDLRQMLSVADLITQLSIATPVPLELGDLVRFEKLRC
jgi:hypothetical protein